MLSPEQEKQIKKQLIEQIDSTFPEDKKEFAKKQLESMDSKQLEEFLKQNNLLTEGENVSAGQKCIFCSIAFGEIPSTKIYEDKNVVIVLELNPVSKGHSLVIPKKHIESSDKIPKEIVELAEKTAKKIKSKLKSKDIILENSNLMGHEIINIIPVYNNENLDSPKQKAEEKDLLKLQKILEIKIEKEPVNLKPKIKELDAEKLWLPKRIP